MSNLQSSSTRPVKSIFVILAAAVSVRLGWALFTPALPTSDFAWYHRVAVAVAQGRGYAINGTPTAFRVPGYPLFLAAVYAVLGSSLFFAKLANVLLGTLTVFLVYSLAKKVFFERIALIAASLVALTPSLILYCGLLASENLVIPLLLASLLLYIHALQTQRTVYVGLAGVMLGLATLTRPAVLLLPAFWLAYLFFTQIRVCKSVMTHALVLGVSIALCIIPWTVRNYRVFNRFVPLATDSGINLLVSFNASSVGRFVPGVHAHLEELGREAGWDDQQLEQAILEEAIGFVREHPFRAVALAPLKLFHLFRDDVSGVIWNFEETSRSSPNWLRWVLLFIAQAYYMLITALALATMLYRRSLAAFPWYGILLTPILCWIAVHLVFFGDDRYHLPILPVIAIFSAFSFSNLVDSLKIRHGEDPSLLLNSGSKREWRL